MAGEPAGDRGAVLRAFGVRVERKAGKGVAGEGMPHARGFPGGPPVVRARDASSSKLGRVASQVTGVDPCLIFIKLHMYLRQFDYPIIR